VLEPSVAAVLRLSRLPSLVAQAWRDAGRISDRWPGGYRQADLGRGVVRVVLPLSTEARDTDLSALLELPLEGRRIYERLPANLWRAFARTAMHGELERGIKAAFDPNDVLNPGILGESQ
jgi:FAD/FMN-containing dehydrogenase